MRRHWQTSFGHMQGCKKTKPRAVTGPHAGYHMTTPQVYKVSVPVCCILTCL
jgi:hypothetical protein